MLFFLPMSCNAVPSAGAAPLRQKSHAGVPGSLPLPAVMKKAPHAERTGHSIKTAGQENTSRFLCTKPEVCSSIQTVTVGPGVSPSQPPKRVADFTASRELHPAPKNIVVIKLHVYYISPRSFCKEQTGKKPGASRETGPGKTSCL